MATAKIIHFNTPCSTPCSAQQHIGGIRQLLGRSRVAANWRSLTAKQRAAICYVAKLRPSTYANLGLEQMTSDERLALQAAAVELLNIKIVTDRAEWLHAGDQLEHHRRTQQEQQREEQNNRKKLERQARQLSQRLETINAKSPVSGN